MASKEYQEALEQHKKALYEKIEEEYSSEEKQMTAKTMFEELGYRQVKEIDIIEYNNYKDSTSVYYEINFIKPFRNIEIVPKINGNAHHFVRLSPRLLNAINKQMEELGWVESED